MWFYFMGAALFSLLIKNRIDRIEDDKQRQMKNLRDLRKAEAVKSYKKKND